MTLSVQKQPNHRKPAGAQINSLQIARRRAFLITLCSISVLAGPLTGSASPQESPTAASPLSAAIVGIAQSVFDTRTQRCEWIDIPDQPARAFRDDRNTVHLVASHYVVRAMVGPTLNRVQRDCRVIYRSPEDPDPSHFQHRNWLAAFYSVKGRGISALVHSEYQADTIPGMCATPAATDNCWWNSITFARSTDNGLSFHVPKSPRNLVASVPYPYIKGNRASAYGYHMPTNILKIAGFYYAMVNDWPFKAQRYGPCLMRTDDIFDPASWRAWNGLDFSVRFINPYQERNSKPEQHVCAPVLAGEVESLVLHEATGYFIATQFTLDDRFGPPGFYLVASADLIHWSEPTLVASTKELLEGERAGNWDYAYFSLIDPASSDQNFSTISSTPYAYYVRFDKNHSPYTRVLFRRQIKLVFSRGIGSQLPSKREPLPAHPR
jgi:hypothetical protein